jgi:hypothetical protein
VFREVRLFILATYTPLRLECFKVELKPSVDLCRCTPPHQHPSFVGHVDCEGEVAVCRDGEGLIFAVCSPDRTRALRIPQPPGHEGGWASFTGCVDDEGRFPVARLYSCQ